MPSRWLSLRERMISDPSATIAVEFALVAPVILALLLGGVDTCRALLAYRNLQQLTSSVAWSAKAQLIPATSRTAAALPASATTVLDNTLFVTYGVARGDLALSVRHLVKPAGTTDLTDSSLYAAGAPLTANNAGIATNMKPGDTRIVVQASKSFKYLFGTGSLQLSARSSI